MTTLLLWILSLNLLISLIEHLIALDTERSTASLFFIKKLGSNFLREWIANTTLNWLINRTTKRILNIHILRRNIKSIGVLILIILLNIIVLHLSLLLTLRTSNKWLLLRIHLISLLIYVNLILLVLWNDILILI